MKYLWSKIKLSTTLQLYLLQSHGGTNVVDYMYSCIEEEAGELWKEVYSCTGGHIHNGRIYTSDYFSD